MLRERLLLLGFPQVILLLEEDELLLATDGLGVAPSELLHEHVLELIGGVPLHGLLIGQVERLWTLQASHKVARQSF